MPFRISFGTGGINNPNPLGPYGNNSGDFVPYKLRDKVNRKLLYAALAFAAIVIGFAIVWGLMETNSPILHAAFSSVPNLLAASLCITIAAAFIFAILLMHAFCEKDLDSISPSGAVFEASTTYRFNLGRKNPTVADAPTIEPTAQIHNASSDKPATDAEETKTKTPVTVIRY